MERFVSKCGLDCRRCPWGPYPRKNMSPQEFEQYRNKAKEILGYMPIRTPCLTCQTPNDRIPSGSKLPNRKCLIRQCVDKSRIDNCAYCTHFPCDTLQATSGVWNRKAMEDKRGSPISQQEYHIFVEPFEGITRLGAIRAALKQEDFLEPAKIATIEKISVFPENLSLSKEETFSYKTIHGLLTGLQRSSLGMKNANTFGQHHKLESRKAHIFRFLWIMGCYGKLEKGEKACLSIDSRTFLATRGSEKSLAIWDFLRDTVFAPLSEFGVSCERIALDGSKEEDQTTGTGYLRYSGWAIRVYFEDKIGGSAGLKTLQAFSRKIEETYGKKAFQHFRDADMQVLAEK